MLKEKEAQTYWQERVKQLGQTAVGYGDQTLLTQDRLYEERKSFIFKHISREAATVDYGCGIGRYSEDFLREYLGLDITKDLLDIAIKENIGDTFMLLNNPWIEGVDLSSMKQFFTATVLQHCHEELVVKIFKSIKECQGSNFTFCLYENSCNFQKPHVVGRSPDVYCHLVSQSGFTVEKFEFNTHIVKNEEHSLSRIKVK